MVNPAAWIVIQHIYWPGMNRYLGPTAITGDWNVRLKKTSEGGTNINVNLLNIDDKVIDMSYTNFPKSSSSLPPLKAKTTGVFEKTIADLIK